MPVDGPQLMEVSVSELARLKGVSKQAVSKRVGKLERDGLLATRIVEGEKRVPIAEYDRLVAETTDFGKTRGPAAEDGRRRSTPEDPVRAIEDARRARYAADLAEIELGKTLGKILLVEDVERAMTRCGEAMVKAIDQMGSEADEVAAAVAKDGEAGARAFLKREIYRLRKVLAEALERAAGEATGAAESTVTGDEEEAAA